MTNRDLLNIPSDRIYKTDAYNLLEAFCDDECGGSSDFAMCDRFDRQKIVNLLIPLIRKEEREKRVSNRK